MASILAHEIRNPLGAISGAEFLIRKQITKIPESDMLLKPLSIIHAEVESTKKILTDMLDYSRTRPPVLEERDMGEVVESIVSGSKYPENMKVKLEIEKTPKVMIDVEEMKQVIRNLINNSVESMVKFTAGEVLVSVFNTTMSDSMLRRNAVGIEVKDTGPGISPENLSKIFEAFFSTKSKGTGLGLAVVKRIVEERHNGKIEVTSELGRGTSMTIRLPNASGL
jgi:two-component system, NtrC family, sensor kinase